MQHARIAPSGRVTRCRRCQRLHSHRGRQSHEKCARNNSSSTPGGITISPRSGTGSITHQAGVPIQNQPLELQLKLAGKAHLAQLLNRLGVLNGTPDDKQYYPMSTPFTLSGSAAQVNSGDLWRILGGAAARAAAGAFLR